MKYLLLTLAVLFFGLSTEAQNEKYITMMKEGITKINYTLSSEEIQKAANQFERIAGVEKGEWLPAYYATIAYITLASKDMENGGQKIQEYIDKAKLTLAMAQELAKDDSEVLTAKAYLSLAHIWINPMLNGAKYSMQAYKEFDEAMAADPNNPRPYYLKAQNIFYTPAAFGGGQANAKELFLIAKEKFEAFEPKTEISPAWGKEANEYFLSLYDNKEGKK